MEQVQWQTGEQTQEDTVSLIEMIRVLVRWRRFIIFSTLIAALFIVAFSLYTAKLSNTSPYNFLPDKYTATAEVRLLQNPGNSLSQQSQPSGGGGLTALLTGVSQGPSNAELAIALLQGNRLADEVANQMGFVQRYHIKNNPRTNSEEIFKKSLKASYKTTSGILTISYTDLDRNFATKVADATLNVLQRRFNSLNQQQVNADVSYFQGRMASAELDLQQAQNELVGFMNKYGIVDLQTQSQHQASEIADLNQQIQNRRLQLSTLESYGRPANDPEVRQLKASIASLQKMVSGIKTGSAGFTVTGGIPADQLPRISAQYTSLKNNVAIQEQVYALIQQQYQTAKIQQNAAMQTLQIVERPMTPETKSGPHRSLICAAFTIAVFALAVFIAFLREYFARAKGDPEQAAKLAEIRRLLGRKSGAER